MLFSFNERQNFSYYYIQHASVVTFWSYNKRSLRLEIGRKGKRENKSSHGKGKVCDHKIIPSFFFSQSDSGPPLFHSLWNIEFICFFEFSQFFRKNLFTTDFSQIWHFSSWCIILSTFSRKHRRPWFSKFHFFFTKIDVFDYIVSSLIKTIDPSRRKL